MRRNVFSYLASHFLTAGELNAWRSPTGKHTSKHSNQRNLKRGRCAIYENSSIMKRMRSTDGFAEVKISPVRRRQHWHSSMRAKWADISKLSTDLEKDRERRRLMRSAA